MQASGIDDGLLPALLNWDCEATQAQQPFSSAFEDLAGYNFSSLLLDNNMTNLSHAPSKSSSSDMVQPPSRIERKLEINRRSQKKVRERRKARMQSTEAQLAEAVAELEDLKSKFKQISTRNALLEKVANIHDQPAAFVTTNGASQQWQDIGLLTENAEKGSAIKLTVNGHDEFFAVEEVSRMPELLYADLYARYANKLGTCLLEISDNEDNPVNSQLTKWVCEVTSLMVCMAQGNPKLALKHGLADFTSSQPKPVPAHRQDVFYVDLLVALELTEAQQRDMMYLRRLLFSKLGQIYRDRQALLSTMPTEAEGVCHCSDKLAEMTDGAEQLRNSGAEELNTYMQSSSAFFRGIQTCKQHATLLVHSYPAIPEKGRLLETLAVQRGEPSKEALMQPSGMDSLQHAANWQQVVDYLQYVNTGNLNQHVPLLVE